jgi:hypothetical protein
LLTRRGRPALGGWLLYMLGQWWRRYLIGARPGQQGNRETWATASGVLTVLVGVLCRRVHLPG